MRSSSIFQSTLQSWHIVREFVHTSKSLKLFTTLHRSSKRLRVSPQESNADQDRKEATSEVVLEGRSWPVALRQAVPYPSTSGGLHITSYHRRLHSSFWLSMISWARQMETDETSGTGHLNRIRTCAFSYIMSAPWKQFNHSWSNFGKEHFQSFEILVSQCFSVYLSWRFWLRLSRSPIFWQAVREMQCTSKESGLWGRPGRAKCCSGSIFSQESLPGYIWLLHVTT